VKQAAVHGKIENVSTVISEEMRRRRHHHHHHHHHFKGASPRFSTGLT
jgi:hypothetical protein